MVLCEWLEDRVWGIGILTTDSFAGSDSTASTMQSFCHHVLREPEIYARVKAELDEATKTGKLSQFPQWNEVQALPYFQACLKEAMRVRPAVGLNITRLVPPEGTEIEGKRFPGGTRVALNGWVLHRDAQIFGSDPKVFRPDRWLEDEAKSKNMERYMFQFGGGSHLCTLPSHAIVRRRQRILTKSRHRQEPRSTGDEQDTTIAIPGVQLRVAETAGRSEAQFNVLRCAKWAGRQDLEARESSMRSL